MTKEHFMKELLTCPHCGHEYQDSWEMCLDHDGEIGDTTCGSCEKDFEYRFNIQRKIVIAFTSWGK